MTVFRTSPWLCGAAMSIFALTPCSRVRAQQTAPPGERRTLADLVGLALQNTQILGSQDARVEQTRLSASQARVWSGPSVEFSTGRRREAAFSGPRYGLALSQPLPILGKPGLRGRLLDLDTESWRVRRDATQIAVTVNVVESAYEFAVNRRKAGFIEKRQRRFELIETYMAGRVFPTPQRKAESRIVQNRLKRLAAETIQSQADYKTSLEKLRVYVPLEAGNYPEVEVPWFSGEKPLDGKEWLAKALESNPDLRVQRLLVKDAELEKSLASRDGLPDPSLVASYEQGKAAETERNYGMGLSLALPPWNRNRSGIKSAAQKRLAEEKQLGFEEQKLKAELPRLLVEYEAARQIILKYPRAVLSELEAQLQDADAGFRKGQVDLLTFLELDNSASETFGRVLDAQRDLAVKAVELMAAAGEKDLLTRLGSL